MSKCSCPFLFVFVKATREALPCCANTADLKDLLHGFCAFRYIFE
jgi:hypothetical protein